MTPNEVTLGAPGPDFGLALAFAGYRRLPVMLLISMADRPPIRERTLRWARVLHFLLYPL